MSSPSNEDQIPQATAAAAPETHASTDPAEAPTDSAPGAVEASSENAFTESAGDPAASGSEGSGPGDGAGRTRQGSRKSELVREGEIAADFLETLLDIADLDGDLEVDIEGDRAAVSIVDSEEGSVPRRLVGPTAGVLEALQELTRLAVQAETGERSWLMLDVAGHRAERKVALVEAARRVVQDVSDQGERRELEPMTAFERKVVHDEVLKAGLRSESEGEEPQRYVVVLPPAGP